MPIRCCRRELKCTNLDTSATPNTTMEREEKREEDSDLIDQLDLKRRSLMYNRRTSWVCIRIMGITITQTFFSGSRVDPEPRQVSGRITHLILSPWPRLLLVRTLAGQRQSDLQSGPLSYLVRLQSISIYF